MSNIISILKENASKYPDKIAIKDKESSITYAELWQQVRSTASYYNSKNIKSGDRVLVFVPMSVNLYINMLAIFYVGATAVFLDQWSSTKRLNLACKIAECKAMVGIKKARLLWFMSSAFRKIPVYLDPKNEKQCPVLEPYSSKKEDTALITFTTGSTGNPKAAKRTHGFLIEQFDALQYTLNPTENDIDLVTLPIFVLMNLGTGGTSVIADFDPRKPATMDPSRIADQVIENKCTRIISSPYFLLELSNYVVHYKKELPSITHLFTGGAPVYPDDCKKFLKAFPTTTNAVIYGSTESEPISEVSFPELANFSKAIEMNGIYVGSPYYKIELRIINISEDAIGSITKDKLTNMSLPAGKIGEIVVSGHHVLTEYYNSEEAFKKNKINVEGKIWHRTGDAGFVDEHGRLYLTGRCNTLLYQQDKILSPFIYEYIINSVETVRCGTLMRLDSKITLIIETKGKQDYDSIETELSMKGLSFDAIRYVDHIPMDQRHFSKIDYDKLKEMFR